MAPALLPPRPLQVGTCTAKRIGRMQVLLLFKLVGVGLLIMMAMLEGWLIDGVDADGLANSDAVFDADASADAAPYHQLDSHSFADRIALLASHHAADVAAITGSDRLAHLASYCASDVAAHSGSDELAYATAHHTPDATAESSPDEHAYECADDAAHRGADDPGADA